MVTDRSVFTTDALQAVQCNKAMILFVVTDTDNGGESGSSIELQVTKEKKTNLADIRVLCHCQVLGEMKMKVTFVKEHS